MTLFIARHGETVFNAAGRMQGSAPHTPLTRLGFRQAEAMGETLRRRLGAAPAIELWASPTGRTLQTLAVIAEHLELDWHEARTDERLAEVDVGEWGGRYHSDLVAGHGPIVDPATGMFSTLPPGGESYQAVAARLRAWLDEQDGEAARLVVMHGMSSRVLRGLLAGLTPLAQCGAPVAGPVPQGRVVEFAGGIETMLDPPEP